MSACQSQGHAGHSASSCATSSPMAAGGFVPPVLPDGEAPIKISETVVGKVAEMLAEEGDPALQLRIFVTGGGCSGFQYGFTFDDTPKEDDLEVARGDIKVLVDAMSLQYLMGAELDYEGSLEGWRCVFRCANATGTCGCGSSFSV
mgnify:CR=1 FL=1